MREQRKRAGVAAALALVAALTGGCSTPPKPNSGPSSQPTPSPGCYTVGFGNKGELPISTVKICFPDQNNATTDGTGVSSKVPVTVKYVGGDGECLSELQYKDSSENLFANSFKNGVEGAEVTTPFGTRLYATIDGDNMGRNSAVIVKNPHYGDNPLSPSSPSLSRSGPVKGQRC